MLKINTLIICLLFATFHLAAQKAGELKFTNDGKFKIVQFTDMHYVVGSEECKKVQNMINQTLDEEKPQLVIFTGDIITSSPQTEGWKEVLEPVVKRGLPWAAVLGNHDDEYDLKRNEIIRFLTKQPYSLVKENKQKIKGATNHALEVKGQDKKTNALIYCLDSHAYSQRENIKGYDWFAFDQVKWYRETSAKYTKKNKNEPFPALAFFHIPLLEYAQLSDTSKCIKIGASMEAECPGPVNTGMFAAFLESGDVMGTFVGHDHDNNYIGSLYGVSMAYGQFSGGNTVYNNNGMGARIIELTEGKRQFDSWIRMSDNSVIFNVQYPKSFIK